MGFYNVCEYTKDFLGINSGMVSPNPDREKDAAALVSLSHGVSYRHSRNNKHYLYYIISNIANRDVIRFLMRRNGFTPEFHNSRYFSKTMPIPVFRIPAKTIFQNPDLREFADLMCFAGLNKSDVNLVKKHLETVKMSMRQKSK